MLSEILDNCGMSQERIAAEAFCSRSTIARAKAGEIILPAGTALRVADITDRPEYTTHYCKNDCEIGQRYCYSLEKRSIGLATLELLYWNGEVQGHTHTLKKISRDGKIEPGETKEVNEAILILMHLEKAIEEYKLSMADVLDIPGLISSINKNDPPPPSKRVI